MKPQEPEIRLAIVLVVDQMRYDFLPRFSGLYSNGFRTLLNEGASFTRAMYRHSTTGTGPGHATIATGKHPSEHGIVANDWLDTSGDQVEVVRDDGVFSNPPGVAELSFADGRASPKRLKAVSLGDKLKETCGSSKVVSIAIKDRAAILMAGKDDSHIALWLDRDSGQYITSTYYSGKLPIWLAGHNSFAGSGEPYLHQYLDNKWERWIGVPSEIYERAARADDAPYEAANKYPGVFRNRTFPHLLSPKASDHDKGRTYDLIRKSPYGPQATLDVVRRAIMGEQLGQKTRRPDLLYVGMSATDLSGHLFGPRSQEAMDAYLRLDMCIGDLIRFLDRTVGRQHYVLTLTGDHGVADVPEYLESIGHDGGRIVKKSAETAVRKALEKDPIAKALHPANDDVYGFYLDKKELPGGTTLEKAEARLAKAVGDTIPGASRVFTSTDIEAGKEKDHFGRLFTNGHHNGRSPNVTFLTKEHYILSAYDSGTGHGTAHDYDRHVPLIVFGGPVKSGTHINTAGPEDIAPFVARVLGVKDDFDVPGDGSDLYDQLV